MKKTELKVEKNEKWIILNIKGKKIKFRRNANTGILLESMLNQGVGVGVPEFYLEQALENKKPLPKLNFKR